MLRDKQSRHSEISSEAVLEILFFHQPSTEVFGEINIWSYLTCGKFEVCRDWHSGRT